MKHTIYYFSGTGNSLKAAKDISAGVQDSELLSMAANIHTASELVPQGAVGFVFPVYYCGLPRLVQEFISEINLASATYIYIVATYGHAGGNSGCISQTKKIFRSKGKKLNAAFYVRHINNFMLYAWDDCAIWALKVTPEKEHTALHENAYKKSTRIAEIVSARKDYYDKSLTEYIGPILFQYNRFYNKVHSNDKAFYATDECTSCGLCVEVCPTNNMEMCDGRPIWKSKTCQRCLACLNLCPPACIQYGEGTRGQRRYKNPHISVAELKRVLNT